MSDVIVGATVVVGVVGTLVVLALVAYRVRRRGSAGPAIGAAMAAYDEAMHSTAHETFIEMQQQSDRAVPIPAPGDHR